MHYNVTGAAPGHVPPTCRSGLSPVKNDNQSVAFGGISETKRLGQHWCGSPATQSVLPSLALAGNWNSRGVDEVDRVT
jgi:hypothetical protein